MSARLLRGIRDHGPLSLAEHIAAHGALPSFGARAGAGLLDIIERSGLRGRGGGHASTAMKLRAVAERRRRPIVLANGAESEPASAKDAVLLTRTPHLVLDGAAVAATAVGADEAIIYVKRPARRAVTEAIAERGARDRIAFKVADAPSAYVAGHETAAIAYVNGGPALPTTVPPRPFERGVGRRPTLVSNVETLAHMALIARHGAEWFREVGTRSQPGTALLTVSGAVGRPGVYESPFGASLRDVLGLAGGTTEPVQALLVGGYGGAWIAADRLAGLHLDDHDPVLGAGSVGAGILVVLGQGRCGVRESAAVLEYLAAESAGQCGPCVHGLHAIAGAFAAVAAGAGDRATLARLHRWGDQVRGRGACRHPDGAARFLASAMEVFAGEIALHAAGRCSGRPAGVLPIPSRVREAA